VIGEIAMAKKGKLKITLVRSTIGEKPKTRAAVRTLGLRRINQVAERPDNGSVRGLLGQVAHLVEVEEA
jgi:large subunit ribosomal protein L30